MADYESFKVESQTSPADKETIAEKFETLKAFTVSSAHAVHDMYAGFLAPLLPFLIERLTLLKVEAGLFLLVYQGASVLQPFIGHIGDSKNLRKYALIMPALTGITLSLLGIAPTFSLALALCLMAGITSATMHAILPALVAKLSGKQVGRGMGFWMVGGEIGVMIGPILVASVISAFGIQATPWLMIPGIATSILLSILLKDMPSHTSLAEKNAIVPLKAIALVMLPMAGMLLLRSPIRTAAEIYLPVYLLEKGVSSFLAGSSVSLLLGFGVIGTAVGGILKIFMVLRSDGVVNCLDIFVYGNFYNKLRNNSSSRVIHCRHYIRYGSACRFGVYSGKFSKNRSLANGIYLATLFALNALAGVFTGFLYDTIGGDSTFLLNSLISLFGIVFVFFLPKEDQKA